LLAPAIPPCRRWKLRRARSCNKRSRQTSAPLRRIPRTKLPLENKNSSLPFTSSTSPKAASFSIYRRQGVTNHRSYSRGDRKSLCGKSCGLARQAPHAGVVAGTRRPTWFWRCQSICGPKISFSTGSSTLPRDRIHSGRKRSERGLVKLPKLSDHAKKSSSGHLPLRLTLLIVAALMYFSFIGEAKIQNLLLLGSAADKVT